MPSALKRWMRFLLRSLGGSSQLVLAISEVRSPCQLKEMMRALVIQSPGAWRLPASLQRPFVPLRHLWVRGLAAALSARSFLLPPFERFGHALMYTLFEERSIRR